MNTRNCECCNKSYATGKEYGFYSHEYSDVHVINGKFAVLRDNEGNIIPNETKGFCEFCNPADDNRWFSCKKHGKEFRIGHFVYRPENNFEKSYEPTDLNRLYEKTG